MHNVCSADTTLSPLSRWGGVVKKEVSEWRVCSVCSSLDLARRCSGVYGDHFLQHLFSLTKPTTPGTLGSKCVRMTSSREAGRCSNPVLKEQGEIPKQICKVGILQGSSPNSWCSYLIPAVLLIGSYYWTSHWAYGQQWLSRTFKLQFFTWDNKQKKPSRNSPQMCLFICLYTGSPEMMIMLFHDLIYRGGSETTDLVTDLGVAPDSGSHFRFQLESGPLFVTSKRLVAPPTCRKSHLSHSSVGEEL